MRIVTTIFHLFLLSQIFFIVLQADKSVLKLIVLINHWSRGKILPIPYILRQEHFIGMRKRWKRTVKRISLYAFRRIVPIGILMGYTTVGQIGTIIYNRFEKGCLLLQKMLQLKILWMEIYRLVMILKREMKAKQRQKKIGISYLKRSIPRDFSHFLCRVTFLLMKEKTVKVL